MTARRSLKFTEKANLLETESRLVVAWLESGNEDLTAKEHKRSFWRKANVLN